MDVTDVLRDRMQTPAGLQKMVTVSIAAHVAILGVLILAPHGFLVHHADAPKPTMTISLGAGSPGPATGGLTAIGGRPVQVQTPPDEPPKREAIRAPAAKVPEMTVPAPNTKTVQSKVAPAPPVKQAPDEARGRTPTRGDKVTQGSAVAETRARGVGFGLSSGGGAGSGATLDVANFCCPDYILQMVERIRSTWDNHADRNVVVGVHFTIERDGRVSQTSIEQSSGSDVLDLAARRAVEVTRQLPPLPASYPNSTLGVHLKFEYQR